MNRQIRRKRKPAVYQIAVVCGVCILIAFILRPAALSAETSDTQMLFNCDSIKGVTISRGDGWPKTQLELNTTRTRVSEGDASLHLSGLSPEDADGNSYLAIDITVGGVDLTKKAIRFDAWTSHPETTQALYVRAFSAEGDCVLSFYNWSRPLGDGARTAVQLVRGFSNILAWEPKRVEADDLSDVQKLRFYIGTHGKGVPFDIYLDNIRAEKTDMQSFEDVKEPKKRVLQTVIAENGKTRAIIIAPDDEGWRAVASDLQATIDSLSGARPPVLSPEEVDKNRMRGTTGIVIGNVVNNRAMLYLYSHEYIFADDFYPGKGGYQVRTVHDPWGTGHNVLSVGASDVAGARAAIRALKKKLTDGEDLKLPPLLLTQLGPEAKKRWGGAFEREPDDEWLQKQKDAAERDLKTGRHKGLFARMSNIGRDYQLTRKSGYARAYVWLLKRARKHRNSDPDTYGGPWGMDSDFAAYEILPQWDVVEECPALSDEQRMTATRILFQWITEAVAPSASSVMGHRRVRHNHQTFPSLGCLYAGEYFHKYYNAGEGKKWLKIADECFQYQSKCYKPHEDCNGYQWLTLYHTMRYSLARGDFAYFDNGNAWRDANYAIMCMDNLGYQVTYGDTGGYRGWFSEMPFLHGAEWYYRDGRYRWATDKKFEVSGDRSMSWFLTQTEAQPPTDLLGASAFPLDPHYYRAFDGEEHVAQEHAVDKVVFRDGFAPQDQYLLLDGLNNGGHKHYDGNSISRMTANGRIWLADASYMLSLPKFHSTAIVLRNGQSQALPPFCELQHFRDLPQVSFSETRLSDYAGVDWHRNIFWLKGQWFVVADEMEALQDGDYSFRILWQTLGDAELERDGVSIQQDGQFCAIRMTPELRFRLVDDAEYGQGWNGYPHIDEPVVRRLQGCWSGHLNKGEQITLFTLLHPSGEKPSDLGVTRLGPNSAAIAGGDSERVAIALGGGEQRISTGQRGGIRASAALVKAGLFALFDALSINLTGQNIDFAGPTDLQAGLGEGTIRMFPAGRTPEPDSTEKPLFYPQLAEFDSKTVREGIRKAIASAPEAKKQTPAGSDAPPLEKIWSYRETLDTYLLTGNSNVLGAVDAGMNMSCEPQPRPYNVFDGPDTNTNVLENIFDGAVQDTENCTQWADDQKVTINISFDDVYSINSILVKAWFATSSSKGKRFQVGDIRIAASQDGFDEDVRTIVDFTDTEEHGNWGDPGHAPEAYRFDNLKMRARDLRMNLTPRSGTAIYIAEIEVWGRGEKLAERLKPQPSPYVFGSTTADDIDGDGEPEVIAGSTNGCVYALDGDGSVLWRADTGHRVNSVCTARLAADKPPAVIAGCMGAAVRAFDANGQALWTFHVPRYKHTGHVRTVFPANLTGDGTESVIAGADNWRYYAIDAGGKKLWHEESVHRSTAGAAADLTGDGRDEILCGTEYHWWPVVGPGGERLFRYRTSTGPGVNDAAAADITGDGTPEVIFGGQDGNVHTVSADGKLLWKFNTGDEVTSLETVQTDGKPMNLIVGSLSFNLYALNGDGTIVWRRDFGHPVVDTTVLTTDDRQRIAAATEDGRLIVVKATDGSVIGQFQLPASPITVTGADLNGDGIQQAVVSTNDGNLTAIQ